MCIRARATLLSARRSPVRARDGGLPRHEAPAGRRCGDDPLVEFLRDCRGDDVRRASRRRTRARLPWPACVSLERGRQRTPPRAPNPKPYHCRRAVSDADRGSYRRRVRSWQGLTKPTAAGRTWSRRSARGYISPEDSERLRHAARGGLAGEGGGPMLPGSARLPVSSGPHAPASRRFHALAIGWRPLRKAHAMHCSMSPSHSMASGWRASADSKAIITHGPSRRVAEVACVASVDEPSGRRHGLAPCEPRASTRAFRHRQHRDGRLVRGKDACLQDTRAVRMREHLQPERIVPTPQWSGGRKRTRRRNQPPVCARPSCGSSRSDPTGGIAPCSRSSVRPSWIDSRRMVRQAGFLPAVAAILARTFAVREDRP